MKVPESLLQLALNIALKNAGFILSAPLEKIPHVDVIAKAYTDGEPLEVIIGLYLQSTKSVADDEIAGKVGEALAFVHNEVPKIIEKFSTLPAKEVIAELLGGLTVPDFDNDTENDKPIVDIINETLAELAE